MIETNDKAKCLICYELITAKTYNVRRHSETKHSEQMKKLLTEDDRTQEFIRLNRKVNSFKVTKYLNRVQIITKISFQISNALLKKQKPFSDGPFIKEMILLTLKEVLKNHRDRDKILAEVESLQLSRQTVTRRCDHLSKCIKNTLREIIKNSEAVSICLDESTDRTDISQLVVFARIVDHKLKVSDNILGLVPLTATTTAADVLKALDVIFDRYEIDAKKITSITTDGEATMVGIRKGLVTLLKERNANIISMKCIIHQESLCAKTGIPEAKAFTDGVMKIVNKAISAGATKHRQFRNFLSENDSSICDLSKMQQVRWLSSSKTFDQFFQTYDLIKSFFSQQNITVPELDDPKWIEKLAFFRDLTSKMSGLNIKLQGNC